MDDVFRESWIRRHERDLLLLALTWAAGNIDAIGYLGLGRVFTANMTGNTVLLGRTSARSRARRRSARSWRSSASASGSSWAPSSSSGFEAWGRGRRR